jgi:hypothetical protein
MRRCFALASRVLLAAFALTAALDGDVAGAEPSTLFGRSVRLDRSGKILSWSAADSPYAHVSRLAWDALETKFPPQENGLPTWLAYSRFDPDTFEGIAWPHNPAGLYAMFTDSAVQWYAYSGDQAAIGLAHTALRHQLAHGTTPASWAWPRVPYASAAAGDGDYGGADDTWCDLCGRGDGLGVIEPDKVGELGFAYLQMFERTGDVELRDAAISCADALARHVRAGDERDSPWPFRVHAETDDIREDYSSNVVGAVMLFDELGRLSLGDVATYARARKMAVDWLFRVPLRNDAWSGYFEDIAIHARPTDNLNQYSAMRTARWLLAHRDADPRWAHHVRHLLGWALDKFGGDTPTERGVQWGAVVMSEQSDDMAKMASHTARFGAVSALWFEASGDTQARARAERSLNWATYACRDSGVVAVGERPSEGFWFSDGYGDYMRYFLIAMAAVPDWAPSGEDHLLGASSIVTHVEYEPKHVAWTTFDEAGSEVLRLSFQPARVLAQGLPLKRVAAGTTGDGYVAEPLKTGGAVVCVRHSSGHQFEIVGGAEEAPPPAALPTAAPSSPRLGCARSPSLALGLGALLALRVARPRKRRAQHGDGRVISTHGASK